MTSDSNSYSELAKRLVTGTLGAFVVIFAIAYSEWGFFAVFLTACVVTQLEFYQLIRASGIIPLRIFGTVVGAVAHTP